MKGRNLPITLQEERTAHLLVSQRQREFRFLKVPAGLLSRGNQVAFYVSMTTITGSAELCSKYWPNTKKQYILLYDQDRVNFSVARRGHGWDLEVILYHLVSFLQVGRMGSFFQGEEIPSGLAQ